MFVTSVWKIKKINIVINLLLVIGYVWTLAFIPDTQHEDLLNSFNSFKSSHPQIKTSNFPKTFLANLSNKINDNINFNSISN